jgi:hypothetical protein
LAVLEKTWCDVTWSCCRCVLRLFRIFASLKSELDLSRFITATILLQYIHSLCRKLAVHAHIDICMHLFTFSVSTESVHFVKLGQLPQLQITYIHL